MEKGERDIIKLKKRLQVCGDFVRSGRRVADIGTDHAYLPLYLLQNGCIPFAIAADINEGPLDSAKMNAERFGLLDQISLRLSDGLAAITADEVDDIVIAGMGGELILRMVLETPWLFSAEKHLILQPMTRAEILRKGLWQNGFEILEEKAIIEEKKVYSVMLVAFCGKAAEPTSIQAVMGKLQAGEEAADAYARKVIASLQRKRQGMLAKGQEREAQALSAAIREIEAVYAGG